MNLQDKKNFLILNPMAAITIKCVPVRFIVAVLSVVLPWMARAADKASCADSVAVALCIERPVNSSFMFDIGGAQILDTYLTPIKYKGLNLRLGYERLQAMKFSPWRWVSQIEAGVDYQKVKNPVGNHTMHSLMGEFQWGMMHRWHIGSVPGLQLMAGGETRFRGGVIYNANNSNNPVSAKIHWSIGLQGMAVYNMRLGKLPVTLRYQVVLPLLGVFFSPEYGQSFYEIYLGDRNGIVHCGWWGNRFDMRNLFTVDLHLGRTSLRLGYRGHIETSYINNLNYHFFTHSAIIGVSGEWLSLKSDKAETERARIISALY